MAIAHHTIALPSVSFYILMTAMDYIDDDYHGQYYMGHICE